jgi:hypothetical protein
MILTIAIPTVLERREIFERLLRFVNQQSANLPIEVIYESDNKEISIGKKRDNLIQRATGEYTVMIDDDDWINDNYVKLTLDALEKKPDCVGYFEKIQHSNQLSCISNRFHDWGNNVSGYDYARTPFFKVPIKTDFCKKIGCLDMRYQEDHDFARRLKSSGLIKTEEFIPSEMYIYRYAYQEHNSKYGIK